ncbi:MAG: UDP-N-acetylmuramoyl-L-alanine--D-glutamate ligase [Cyanobacteriota bacterium]|nr:UDP-N-acetylmuramoyl-L-alanine--D-glutamate ligase [Cyanobacteriota bacterium]
MSSAPAPLSVVVGLGRAGVGVARLLRAEGRPVLLVESNDTQALRQKAQELAGEGLEVRLATGLDADAIAALDPAEVIVSPGIRFDHPALEELRRRGVPVLGEMGPAWRATTGVPWIGITGTNGKTTVTQLVHHLLGAAGLDAPLCGNVGFSAAELALQRRQGPRPDWLVVELSSYQIEASPELAPRLGLWTTLTPDHLDRHGTLDRYRAIKRQLLEASAERILNADDADLRARASTWDKAHWVTARSRSELPETITPLLWIESGQVCAADGPLFPAEALAMPGQHNRQNLVMATAVGHCLGLAPTVMEAAFRTFSGVPHRLERIREHRGITWFNDSKATNFDAAEVALRALDGPLVVLAGGQAKEGDPSAWLDQLARQAAAVVLFGAACEFLTALLQQAGYPGRLLGVAGLEEAVAAADSLAGALGCRAVLLSPACASFDQYRDFEARGHHFRQLVEQLPLTRRADDQPLADEK